MGGSSTCLTLDSDVAHGEEARVEVAGSSENAKHWGGGDIEIALQKVRGQMRIGLEGEAANITEVVTEHKELNGGIVADAMSNGNAVALHRVERRGGSVLDAVDHLTERVPRPPGLSRLAMLSA